MNDNKPCRQELMNRINAASFAVDDVKLFLDTHPATRMPWNILKNIRKCANVLCTNMPNTTVRSPSILCAQTPVKTGVGSMNRGHGRKGDASICGIMRNDCNIR